MTLKPLVDGQLPSTKTTAYGPVPGGLVVILKGLSWVNTDSAPRTFNAYIKKAGGISRRIVPKDLSLAAGAQHTDTVPWVIEAGGELEWDASAANVIDGIVNGAIMEQSSVNLGEFMWSMIKKTGDEPRTNTTLADDSQLKFSMAPNTNYAIRVRVFFTTNSTADFQYRITGPASPTLVRREIVRGAGGNVPALQLVATDYDGPGGVSLDGGGAEGVIFEDMIVNNGSTTGSFVFQWAPINASGSTTVRRGSYLEYIPI